MVGDRRTQRRVVAGLTDRADPARTAYIGAGQRWADDVMLVYGPLAAHLVERCPVTVQGCDVLDAGAGTGAAGALLATAGGRVVSCDLEHSMLRADGTPSEVHRAAVADITALPFGDAAFDIGVAAFVLNHLADPVAGLRELERVTRSDGVVLASVFADDRAPAKDAIDAVLVAWGWQPPGWYQAMQQRAEALATTQKMTDAASHAGFVETMVSCAEIDVGLDDAPLVVRYRFGMPQVSAYIDSLAPTARAALFADATAAVEQTGQPFRPTVIELVARVS